MKKTVFLIATLIFSLYLTGCARNNVNDNVANRNRNGTEPTRVNYNNPNRGGGPAITGVDNNTRMDRNTNRNNVTNVGDDNRSQMRVADKAADKIADMPEVDTANVIVTDDNAYVAAKLNDSANQLTTSIEDKISQKVKSVDPDIDNVYVSVNPDFFKQMNDYAGDIRSGRPISGFFNEFSDMIRRVFPDVK
jgi:spore cortex protein